jgi:hypothetical protein
MKHLGQLRLLQHVQQIQLFQQQGARRLLTLRLSQLVELQIKVLQQRLIPVL